MVESVRNTSLLIAIRDAGYVCSDLIAAGGPEELRGWRVSCDGALVYVVSVDGAGRVAVEPVPYSEGYFYADPNAAPPWLERRQEPQRSIGPPLEPTEPDR